MQLVVDDPYLKIPAVKWNHFEFRVDKNYTYLAADENIFSKKSREMIIFKIDRVTKFLAILKVESELENGRYSTALHELTQANIFLPDIDKQLATLMGELKSLNGSLRLFSSDEQLSNHIQELYQGFISSYMELITT